MQRANVLALSAFLLVGLGQDQKPPTERDDRPELSKAARLANRKTEKALQGAWRLVDMRLVANDSAGLNQGELDHVGFDDGAAGLVAVGEVCRTGGRAGAVERHFAATAQAVAQAVGQGGAAASRSIPVIAPRADFP